MASVLFVTWDGGGNVPPAVALARELVRRGHSVRVLGHAVQATALTEAGLEVAPSRRARPFSRAAEPSALEMLRALADRGLGRDLVDALQVSRADLVVVDAMLFGALEAVRRSGTPYVLLEHLLDSYYEQGCLRGQMGLAVRALGLAPRRAVAGARLRLVMALPELEERLPYAGARLRHLGPVVDHGPRRTATPAVLVSLSTFGYRGMTVVLQRVVDAVAELGVRVVVTTGPLIDPAAIRARDGIEIHGHIPHADLMPEVSLLIGHGGHGTTMQALAHDVPVLVLPLYARSDQPWVARALERSGAGRAIRRDAPVAAIADAAAGLLADGPHRAAATRLGAAIRAMPGAAGGADAVEQALVG